MLVASRTRECDRQVREVRRADDDCVDIGVLGDFLIFGRCFDRAPLLLPLGEKFFIGIANRDQFRTGIKLDRKSVV